jgi:hypothetical protein
LQNGLSVGKFDVQDIAMTESAPVSEVKARSAKRKRGRVLHKPRKGPPVRHDDNDDLPAFGIGDPGDEQPS